MQLSLNRNSISLCAFNDIICYHLADTLFFREQAKHLSAYCLVRTGHFWSDTKVCIHALYTQKQ